MKTYIIMTLLLLGITVYAADPVPVEPFSNQWPSQTATLRSGTSGNPFDDIPDNPDPDPVPVGDSFGWVVILGMGYLGVKYWLATKGKSKRHHH